MRSLFAGVAVLVLAGPALAQDARHTFDIPAQDAVSALQAFAKQAGKQVLFPFEAASGRKTPAVVGEIADSEAEAKNSRTWQSVGCTVSSTRSNSAKPTGLVSMASSAARAVLSVPWLSSRNINALPSPAARRRNTSMSYHEV